MTTGVADYQLSTSTRLSVQLAGWAAILWGVLSVTRIPLTGEADMPMWTDPATDIASFYSSQDFGTSFVIGIAMAVVGWSLIGVGWIAAVAQFGVNVQTSRHISREARERLYRRPNVQIGVVPHIAGEHRGLAVVGTF